MVGDTSVTDSILLFSPLKGKLAPVHCAWVRESETWISLLYGNGFD